MASVRDKMSKMLGDCTFCKEKDVPVVWIMLPTHMGPSICKECADSAVGAHNRFGIVAYDEYGEHVYG